MDTLYVPILIALAVALLVFGIASTADTVLGSGKRKLKQRLRDDAASSTRSQLPLSITRNVEATGASAMLVKWEPLQDLHRMVVQAYPSMTVSAFICIAAIAALIVFMVLLAVTENMVIAPLAGLAGAYVPFLMLQQKRARRQRALAMQLPEALEFLARILQAGHSFSTGVQMMSEELPDPLRSEFRHCYEQHSLGRPLEEALSEMAVRIQSTDFAFFVTAVLIQRQTGGDLSEVLKNISSMIRQRMRLAQHVKAKTAEGRLTGYILVAFPAVMFVVMSCISPASTRSLTHTSLGQKMLVMAFLLQMLGLWAIRKITTVKV